MAAYRGWRLKAAVLVVAMLVALGAFHSGHGVRRR